jgi:diketogulonate reductase-like aldo/keto reductase
MSIPTIALNNGVKMPALGFGVFQSAPEETADAVTTALEVGYRHIDRGQGTRKSTLEDPTIVAIAAEHDRTPAQAMLRWHLHR